MIRLLGLAISIGIADSLNPTTIGPALYLASGRHPRRQVAEFTAAVFGVYLIGGLVIALGPGHLLLSLIPSPRPHLGYLLEAIAGVAMIAGSAFLWGYRHRLSAAASPPQPKPGSKSSAILGATIMAVELPTAFPYFATIAAIVAADVDVVRTFFLLLVFNVFFIAPLLVILGVLTFAGPRSQRLLNAGREKLEAHWPAVLAILSLLAGLIVTFLGVTGLAYRHHNDFGTFSRHLRRLFHLRS